MGNTGYKSFTTLERYYTDNNSPTGETKLNAVSDPDYIAPFLDAENCPPSTRYYNTQQIKTVQKNNCSTGYSGSNVTLTAFANQFVSNESLAEANNQAIAWLDANAQIYANNVGTCLLNIINLPVTKSVIFENRNQSWIDCRNASTATTSYQSNNFLGAANNGSEFIISRYRGSIDTSSVSQKPKSAKLKFKFAQNAVGNALTFHLYSSNVPIPLSQNFELVDWNDWDQSNFIGSTTFPSNSTEYREIILNNAQLDSLSLHEDFNFFIISNGDKLSNAPTSDNRPTLSITADTGNIYLECEF